MIFTQHQTGDVGRHQADKPDFANETHGRRGQQAHPHQHHQAHTFHPDAQTAGLLLTTAQQGHGPGITKRKRQAQRKHQGDNGHFVQTGPSQATHGPEHNLLNRLGIGHELDQAHHCVDAE